MDVIESGQAILIGTTALGCGLVAGGFFAFSTFVMAALGRLPPEEGIAAMQAINVVVLRSPFLAVFVGTGATCGALVLIALSTWERPSSAWLLAGAGLYLLGTIAVTGLHNVPLNNALAAVVSGDPGGATIWERYLVDWTRWNHIRTAAALGSAAALAIASHQSL
jgi:uncharacterized membrane protein